MANNATHVWLAQLERLVSSGLAVAPRNFDTYELLHETVVVDMRRPVVRSVTRRLSYQFMVAEAYWILTGDCLVETIAPYNQRIAQFSDDGQTFFGAYGPKIVAQLPYVITTLQRDPQSRQAGLTIWRESPPSTKDVPCTVTIFFSLRHQNLHAHVFMRSSDVWLGLPYDIFNFSMLAHLVCAHLNSSSPIGSGIIAPGDLYLTMASSHLYFHDLDFAVRCLSNPEAHYQPTTPEALFNNPNYLLDRLKDLRETSPGDSERWWEH